MYKVIINNHIISNDVISEIQFTSSMFSPIIDGRISLNNTSTLKDVLTYDRKQTLQIVMDDIILGDGMGLMFNIDYQDTGFTHTSSSGIDNIRFCTFNNQIFQKKSKKIYEDTIENIISSMMGDYGIKVQMDVKTAEKIVHPCNNNTILSNIQYLLQYLADSTGIGGYCFYYDIVSGKLVLENIKNMYNRNRTGYPILFPVDRDSYIGYADAVDIEYSFDQHSMYDNSVFNNVQHGFDRDSAELILLDTDVLDIKPDIPTIIPFDKELIELNTVEYVHNNKSENLIKNYKSNLYWKNLISMVQYGISLPNGTLARGVGLPQDLIIYTTDENGPVTDKKYSMTGIITEITHRLVGESYSQIIRLNNIGFNKDSGLSPDILVKL